jgi:hypothetical protein
MKKGKPRKTGAADWRPFRLDTKARPSWMALSKDAKCYWMIARLNMHSSGLDLTQAVTIASWASMTMEEAAAAESELVAAGEIVRDGAVLWIVHGLDEHKGTSFLEENSKHRANVRSHLAKFGSSPLIAMFRSRYPGWVEDHPVDKAAEPTGQLNLMPQIRVVSSSSQPRTDTVSDTVSHTVSKGNRITENREQKPATSVAGVLVPPVGTQDAAREETLLEGVSCAPNSGTATAPFGSDDPDIVFDQLCQRARRTSWQPELLRQLPTPVASGLKAIRGLTRLMHAQEYELTQLRGTFRGAFVRARDPTPAPPGQERMQA